MKDSLSSKNNYMKQCELDLGERSQVSLREELDKNSARVQELSVKTALGHKIACKDKDITELKDAIKDSEDELNLSKSRVTELDSVILDKK